MTGDEKKRDPIFTVCFVVFILAAVSVGGVYIDEHYLTEDTTKAAYGDQVTVNYTGSGSGAGVTSAIDGTANLGLAPSSNPTASTSPATAPCPSRSEETKC